MTVLSCVKLPTYTSSRSAPPRIAPRVISPQAGVENSAPSPHCSSAASQWYRPVRHSLVSPMSSRTTSSPKRPKSQSQKNARDGRWPARRYRRSLDTHTHTAVSSRPIELASSDTAKQVNLPDPNNLARFDSFSFAPAMGGDILSAVFRFAFQDNKKRGRNGTPKQKPMDAASKKPTGVERRVSRSKVCRGVC